MDFLSGIVITKVVRRQIDSVMALIENAVRDMERNNIFQWDEIYPDTKTILSDIDAGCLYSAQLNHSIVGVVALNEEQSPEYRSIEWSSHVRPLVVHRLCVDPVHHGWGIAKHLMRYAEKYGMENKYGSLRLDAFIANSRAVGLYDSLGYARKGIVLFRKGAFYCYEKIL